MFNNISIQVKLLSSLAFIIAITLISGVFSSASMISASSAVRNMEKVLELESDVSHLEFKLNEAHKYIVSFLNAGDLQAKLAYEEVAKELPQIFNNTEKNIAEYIYLLSDEGVMEHLSKVKEQYTHWQKDIASKQVDFMRSPSTVDMARILENSEDNKMIWSGIKEQMEEAIEELKKAAHAESLLTQGAMNSTMIGSILGVILTILTTLAVSIFIIFMVSRPLKALVGVTAKLVDKDWSVEISGTNRGDEIGQMASALLQFREGGIENDRLVEEQEKEAGKRLERAQAIEKLVGDFREESSVVTSALEDATRKMGESSITMNDIANNTSRLSDEVAQSAKNAGDNVNNVASASEELTASIQEISRQLTKTNDMVLDAKEISNNTVEKMRVLESSANEINSVMELIYDIAEQTNLLALNATIEAARAGEAGKGFAVVASEVKNLASETAKATEQVQTQINRIQSDTVEAVEFIERISNSIEMLTENMSSIAAAMEEQTSATEEISRNVGEASNGTSAVVKNISDVSDSSRQTQETSQNVSSVAEELSKRSEDLKQSISTFIENIQAA